MNFNSFHHANQHHASHGAFLHFCSEPSHNWHLTTEHLMNFEFLPDLLPELSNQSKNGSHSGTHKVDSSSGFVMSLQFSFHSWHSWHAHVQHLSDHLCFVTLFHAQYCGQFPSSSEMMSSMISFDRSVPLHIGRPPFK